MAGMVRPKSFPVRDVLSNKQENGICYNPYRYAMHGGLDAGSKYPGRDSAGFRNVDPPTNINPAQIADRSISE